MITSNLTFTLNKKIIILINLNKLVMALEYAKEDIDLYFFILANISKKHVVTVTRNQAFKFLVKQDKLRSILNDLIARHRLLINKTKKSIIFTNKDQQEITQIIQQLEQESDIFNELHFKVKRTYIRFTNEHFQAGWGQSYKIA